MQSSFSQKLLQPQRTVIKHTLTFMVLMTFPADDEMIPDILGPATFTPVRFA